MGRELEDVEKPFVARLQALGWVHAAGSLEDPAVTGRTNFAEVIQKGVLRALKLALMDDLLTGRVRVTPLLEGAAP